MNRPRPLPAGARMIVALALGAASMAPGGCQPSSEGRPAGSIEVKGGRSSAANVEAAKAKAKAKSSPLGR